MNDLHSPISRLLLGLIAALCTSVSWGGFEIGNGRKVIVNGTGGYSIVIPEKMEVGNSKTFTEVITPLPAGTPRARLQINVVRDEGLITIHDLVDSRKDGVWTPINLAGLAGIQKEETLPTRLRQIEIRLLLRPREILVVNLEGVPGPSMMNPFETIRESLETLKVFNK